MTSSHRAIGIPLLIVLALLATLLLAPGGGTHALWVDRETQVVGSVSTDRMSLTAEGPGVQQELPDTSNIAVQNTSENLSGTLAVTSSVTPVGVDNGLAGQVAVSYAECATGAPIGSVPLGPGETRDLCLATASGLPTAELVGRYAGATVEVHSELTQTAVDAPSWSANADVTTEHHIAFPQPTHPGDELVLPEVCREPLLVGSPTIVWAWPDAKAKSASSDAVARWELEIKTASGWDRIASADADARSLQLPGPVLGLLNNSWLRVVGYAKTDPNTKVVATFEVRVTALLSLGGVVVGASCAEAVPVP